jgi:hypothetical protein
LSFRDGVQRNRVKRRFCLAKQMIAAADSNLVPEYYWKALLGYCR